MAENFVRRNVGFEGILVGPFKQGLTGKQNLKVEYFIKDKKGTHGCTSYTTAKTNAADIILKRKPGDRISCQGDVSDDGRITIWVIADEEKKEELAGKLRKSLRYAKPPEGKEGYVRLYSKEVAPGIWSYSWMPLEGLGLYGKKFNGKWYVDEAYEKLVLEREEMLNPKPTYILDANV